VIGETGDRTLVGDGPEGCDIRSSSLEGLVERLERGLLLLESVGIEVSMARIGIAAPREGD
jgi:hypothetical protein